MTQTAVPSRVVSRSPWRACAPALVMGGVLALVFWTLPNWPLFWSRLAQFPELWHLPSNRLALLLLVLKIIAPIPIMVLIGSVFALSASLKPPATEPASMRQDTQNTLLEIVQQATRPLPFPLAPPDLDTTPATALPFVPTERPSRRIDPITPLPPILAPPEARASAQETASSSLTDRSSSHADERGQDAPSPVSSATMLTRAEPPAPASQPLTLVQERSTSHHLLSIRLLKEVSISVCIPGGGTIAVSFPTHAKRLLLLAYLAWRRGEMIDRDKILEQIFGWGLPDDEASEEKLAERFDSHKKILRRRIREVVQTQVNEPAGTLVIDPEIDPFVNMTGYWGLSGICCVEDIEAVDAAHKVIAHARKEGKLVDEVPAFVKDACDQLLAAYSGDFLDGLMKTYPAEFRPFQGRSSWARKPFTQLRDAYLEAIWYTAVYEAQQGQRSDQQATEDASSGSGQHAFGRAAEWYYHYAMYACNTKFDAKVSIGAQGEPSERVVMSERAIRRCVSLLGTMGRTDHVDQVWSSYSVQMKSLFDQRWTPSKETRADVEAARAQTSAHRFSATFGHRQTQSPPQEEGHPSSVYE